MQGVIQITGLCKHGRSEMDPCTCHWTVPGPDLVLQTFCLLHLLLQIEVGEATCTLRRTLSDCGVGEWERGWKNKVNDG